MELLLQSGFDTSLHDMQSFGEKMHVTFFDKESMFRIDMKGIYADKDRESVEEGVLVQIDDLELVLDSFENLIVNKLLFGSQIDLEDVMAIIARNYDEIDFEKLSPKAIKLDVQNDLTELMQKYWDNTKK